MKNATGNKSRISRAKWKLPSRELVAKTNGPLTDLLKSEEWASSTAKLPLALGQELNGHWVIPDLAQLRHLLIAGISFEKDNCIHSVLAGLLSVRTPDEMRLILMDGTMNQLSRYGKLPHLLSPLLKTNKRIDRALLWAVDEFDSRVELLRQAGVRDIDAYNERIRKSASEKGLKQASRKIPHVVIIISELWFVELGSAVFPRFCKVVEERAYKTGIHLIGMTMEPDESLTKSLQSSIRGRVAFNLLNADFSRLVIGQSGAEKLDLNRDMLIRLRAGRVIRAQGARILPAETAKIVRFWAKQGKPDYIPEFGPKETRGEIGIHSVKTRR